MILLKKTNFLIKKKIYIILLYKNLLKLRIKKQTNQIFKSHLFKNIKKEIAVFKTF
jgi:ribosomal protein L29